MFRVLPYRNPSRFVRVAMTDVKAPDDGGVVSAPVSLSWRKYRKKVGQFAVGALREEQLNHVVVFAHDCNDERPFARLAFDVNTLLQKSLHHVRIVILGGANQLPIGTEVLVSFATRRGCWWPISNNHHYCL